MIQLRGYWIFYSQYFIIRNKNPLRDELLLDHEFVLGDGGDLAVPLDKPGLGVTVNMEALERFKI